MAIDEGKQGEKGDVNEETVLKGDFDKVSGERDGLQQSLDDARAEIFTPEYMAFLDAKDKPPVKDDDKQKDNVNEDVLDKMTNKEILALATKTAKESIQAELDSDRKSRKSDSDAATQREIARFAKTHEDYEKLRPAMYGLSLKKEYADIGLQELYDKAKVYVKSLQEEPTETDKKKQRSMDGLKPGNSSGTYSFDKKVDGNTAAIEAAEETAESLGPLPTA